MDVATLISGDPTAVDDNKYHQTLTTGSVVVHGAHHKWWQGLEQGILSAIGLVLAP